MQRSILPMRHATPRAWWLAVVVLLTSTTVSWAQDEAGIRGDGIESRPAIDVVIRQGTELEQQKRWVEALSHYEKAVHEYPQRSELKDRLTLAQIHCDIARRYGDVSFQRLVSRLDAQQALAVYAEVLTKIQAHYLHQPNWQDMLWRGTANIDVAVTERPFLDLHVRQATEAQINAFRRELRADINTRRVAGREESQAVVSRCSKMAGQRLGLRPGAVILEYVCGAISSLDPYSSYLTGSQLDDVYNQIDGSFVGLGIELKSDEGSLLILKTIPGGPAAGAGIRPGDRIVEVDGHSTQDTSTDEAADMLKGERGSQVRVVVQSPEGQLRHLTIERQEVEVPSVEQVRILDRANGIGYFRLASFQKTTSRDVDAALWRLHRDGMRSLIIDVRGNPGGLLTASVEAADKFVRQGMIVSTRGRSHREDFDYRAHKVGTWPVPLVVLIDHDTASASEIFAGALGDHRRATVIGEPSYGKGSVQGIFPLQVARAGVRLTTAKFYSPSGQAISHHGVLPTVTVRQTHKPVRPSGRLTTGDPDGDEVLSAALEVARRQIASQQRQPRADG